MANITFTSDGGITATGTITAPSFSGNLAWSNITDKPSFFESAGSNPSCGDGTAITQPGGEAVVSIRTTTSGSRDVGILYISQDNCYIANSSDNSYTFGVFDTDLTQDMSSTDTASFVVLASGSGCKTRGSMSATSFNATSARDKKENIEKTKIKALELLNTVEVVDFNFKDDKDKVPKVGFIADDTDSILATPEHNQMDVTNCVGVLIKAVQELTDKNNLLEKRIKELEEKLNG